jgi:hypothetical protein
MIGSYQSRSPKDALLTKLSHSVPGRKLLVRRKRGVCTVQET